MLLSMSETKLRVNEIFDSIEGEGKRAGQLVTFIRLTGCNLRCSYCDTEYAFAEGKDFSIKEIMEQIHHNKVTLTGGEPLLQANVLQLLAALHGHEVNIETNGSINIEPFFVYPNAFFTLDYKCGSSLMSDKMCENNFKKMRKRDVLKFVVGSMEDLEQAKQAYLKYYANLRNRMIYVSPVFGQVEPAQIVEFIKANNLYTWRVQLQLHKFIWNPNQRGV